MFYDDEILQKRVVLLGEAGCGKSTFSKHLTNVWFEIATHPQFSDVDSIKHFQYIFYVSFRFAEENDTIFDMITKQLFDDEKMKKVSQYVLKHLSENCLIVLDGVDEWKASPSYETGRRGDLIGLPGLEGVEDCVILITSRPWRYYSMHSKTRNIFRCLKIDGIKNVNVLAEKILRQLEVQEPEESVNEFLRQVKNRNMSELMKIPLILILTLGVWVDDKSLHRSLCINYANMTQSFIRRSKGLSGWPSKLLQLNLNLKYLETEWAQRSNELPPRLSQYETIQRYAGLLLSIGHLAFDLLLGKEEPTLIFSKATLKKYLLAVDDNDERIYVCLAFGIISKTETVTRGLKKLESYAICHKTFQEFFAALWLISMIRTEKTTLYQCFKVFRNLHEYSVVIQFLCGFDPAIGKEFWIHAANETKGETEAWKRIALQELACRCMSEHYFDPRDKTSVQVYFCIPHIIIDDVSSDESIMLLCQVMEKYHCNVKSVKVAYQFSTKQPEPNIYSRSISYCSGLQSVTLEDIPYVCIRTLTALDL